MTSLGKHWKLSEETKKRQSKTRIGKPLSEKHKQELKIGWLKRKEKFGVSGMPNLEEAKKNGWGFKEEHLPWNKGTRGIMKSWTKGKPLSESLKKKLSDARKRFYENNPHPKGMLGKKESEEHKKKIGEATKRNMSNPLILKKVLRRREKSSLEIRFEDIINKLGLPYRFVGNGEVIVARKVPDFVHKDKNIAVEVYYRKHKEQFRNGLEVWKAERAKIFTEEGWQIIFFDETQINEQNVKNILGNSN